MTETITSMYDKNFRMAAGNVISNTPDDLSRPPTMSEEELRSTLEQGRLVSRLRAAEKISTVVMAYMDDIDTKDMLSESYVRAVTKNLEDKTLELQNFTSTTPLTHLQTPRISKKNTSEKDTKAPMIRNVKGDFLKRRQSAICAQTDPEIFYPEQGGSTRLAKKICKLSCDLQEECLSHALVNGERFGIWGGFSESERRKISKQITA